MIKKKIRMGLCLPVTVDLEVIVEDGEVKITRAEFAHNQSISVRMVEENMKGEDFDELERLSK